MARQYQDILPVVQQAQQAFGGPNVGESLPTAEEESPYLQQFPEDPELAARGMPDETPLTEADMYQESPALPEEPGAAPVDDLPQKQDHLNHLGVLLPVLKILMRKEILLVGHMSLTVMVA